MPILLIKTFSYCHHGAVWGRGSKSSPAAPVVSRISFRNVEMQGYAARLDMTFKPRRLAYLIRRQLRGEGG